MNELLQNQMLVGLVGATLTGAVLYTLRALPPLLWQLLQDSVCVEVKIQGRDELFDWTLEWMARQPYAARARNLMVLSSPAEEGKIKLVPGTGTHLLWHGNWPLFIRRNEKEAKATISMADAGRNETLTVISPGRSQVRIREFIESVQALRRRRERIEVRVWQNGWWMPLTSKGKRGVESVFLPLGLKTALMEDAAWFFGAQAWYAERGVPYRRGWRFEGPPGTGKTTTIKAIASAFDRPIYYLNLSTVRGDVDLLSAFLSAPADAILLLEDIDTVRVSHERKSARQPSATERSDEKEEEDSMGVTLSGLLNAIDGVAAADGRLLVMTTNHPEKLDPALVRAGRVDRAWRFEHMAAAQVAEMVAAFFPGRPDLATAILATGSRLASRSAAAWQGFLMDCRDEPDEILGYCAARLEAS